MMLPVSALEFRFVPVSNFIYLPCSICICAVYFLAIFRRNFNGIIVFYVCIINTNSIHASYPLPSGLWPERGQWSVSKLVEDTHPQRMPRAMAVMVVGVCKYP